MVQPGDLPTPRGTLIAGRRLSALTWLRVGGPAEWLFQPADEDDLAAFLAALDPAVPVFALGAGSNLIVRDGGVAGVVIRLGRGFNAVTLDGAITAGAAVPDAHLARRAAAAGRDLTFLRTIPGMIGGAVRMNAGCYGRYLADHLIAARVVTRDGRVAELPAAELSLGYRSSDLPPGAIVTAARFAAPAGEPAALERAMEAQLAHRDATQPTRHRSAGSTFRNPAGRSSEMGGETDHALKAWSLIDAAGMRGARLEGARMSPDHPNFLLNTGGASAASLEALGEAVRKRVLQTSGLQLEWEVMRVGERPRQE